MNLPESPGLDLKEADRVVVHASEKLRVVDANLRAKNGGGWRNVGRARVNKNTRGQPQQAKIGQLAQEERSSTGTAAARRKNRVPPPPPARQHSPPPSLSTPYRWDEDAAGVVEAEEGRDGVPLQQVAGVEDHGRVELAHLRNGIRRQPWLDTCLMCAYSAHQSPTQQLQTNTCPQQSDQVECWVAPSPGAGRAGPRGAPRASPGTGAAPSPRPAPPAEETRIQQLHKKKVEK